MRIKHVHVKDYGTSIHVLVGKPEPSDEWILQNWSKSKRLTLLIDMTTSRSRIAFCSFNHPPYDFLAFGCGFDKNHTTVQLAKAVREMTFEEIPDELDVRDYCDGVECPYDCKTEREGKQ